MEPFSIYYVWYIYTLTIQSNSKQNNFIENYLNTLKKKPLWAWIFDSTCTMVYFMSIDYGSTWAVYSIQFNSVYWPIKGPQGATGKLYIHE